MSSRKIDCEFSRIYLGVNGVKILKDIVKLAPSRIYPRAIIETLFSTSLRKQNSLIFISSNHFLVRYPEITDEMVDCAMNAIHELVKESLTDLDLFYDLINVAFVQEQFSYRSEENPQLYSNFYLTFSVRVVLI